MTSKATTAQKIGLVVLVIGVLYMLWGFVASWWLVPSSHEGAEITAGSAGMIWSMSFPLGSFVAIAGAGLYAQVEGRRIAALVGVWLLFAAWQILFAPQFASLVFGIGGGLIMLLFLGVVWNWVRARPTLSESQKLGADVQMIGFAFLVTAAWHICGLMGPPAFALRPDLMDAQSMVTGGVQQASSLMAELVLGWAFVFAGQRLALREKTVKTRKARAAVATD